MLENCRVMIPGDRLIAGYHYPEIATKKTLFREYLCEKKNIFEIFWGGGLLQGLGTHDS